MRRILPAAVVAAAGVTGALLAGPAAAHHDCAPGQAAVHVRNPRTGGELVYACVPNPEMQPLIDDCPSGSSGMVLNVPVIGPIYFCSGP